MVQLYAKHYPHNCKQSHLDIQLHPPTIRIRTEVTNQKRVAILIADNGPGMTYAVPLEIFDPFFTTKSVAKGTGLGLPISYQIVVEKHSDPSQVYFRARTRGRVSH